MILVIWMFTVHWFFFTWRICDGIALLAEFCVVFKLAGIFPALRGCLFWLHVWALLLH